MKRPVVLCLSLLFLFHLASAKNDFKAVDQYVRSLDMGSQSLKAFTRGPLIEESATDIEKVRAIYIWLTDNIAYDCYAYKNNKPIRIRYRSERELREKEAALDQQQIRKTLRSKKGICGDYALLFNEMCGFLGIEAKKVSGYVKVHHSQIGKLPSGTNHAWNAFKVDGRWYLVDATWGAGYTNPEVTRFKKFYRDEYFMMPPEDMVKDHFPDDDRWQLLRDPISKRAFADQPIYHINYWALGIQNMSPTEGKINPYNVQFRFNSNQDLDTKRLVILQNGKVVEGTFTKRGDTYFVRPGLKSSSRRIVVGWLKTPKRVEPIVEYKL